MRILIGHIFGFGAPITRFRLRQIAMRQTVPELPKVLGCHPRYRAYLQHAAHIAVPEVGSTVV